MSDDKTREAQLGRIRALLAKTTSNGCTEAEAEAAAALVDKLLAQYGMSLDEAAVAEQEIVRLDIAAAAHPVRYAARRIAEFADCKPWTDGADLVFLGCEIDTDVCEYITMLFMRAIDRESLSYTMFNEDYAMRNAAGQKEMLFSFQVGCASRLGERLTEMKSKRDFTQRGTERDLVAMKQPLVDEAFVTLGIVLGSGRAGRSIRDNAAYNAGRSAADGVAINQGVGSGRTTTRGAIR